MFRRHIVYVNIRYSASADLRRWADQRNHTSGAPTAGSPAGRSNANLSFVSGLMPISAQQHTLSTYILRARPAQNLSARLHREAVPIPPESVAAVAMESRLQTRPSDRGQSGTERASVAALNAARWGRLPCWLGVCLRGSASEIGAAVWPAPESRDGSSGVGRPRFSGPEAHGFPANGLARLYFRWGVMVTSGWKA